MSDNVCSLIKESISIKEKILCDASLIAQINAVSQAVLKTIRSGGKVIFAGNGGSFSDSIHLAAEFVSRFQKERQPLASIALGANNSILTAVANDYCYEDVFLRECKALASKADTFIGLSTSGNSENVIRAIKYAKSIGVTTYAFTGETGGKLNELVECLRVPSNSTARIQEAHIMIGHIMCELVELEVYNHEVSRELLSV